MERTPFFIESVCEEVQAVAIAICSNQACGTTRHYEPSKKKKATRMLCHECGEPMRYPTPEETARFAKKLVGRQGQRDVGTKG